MSKLAKELFHSIATFVHRARGPWRLAHASETIHHDPNARAGGYESDQVKAGLFGVLVSNRDSRF
jgi:hypothetical protein